MISRFIRKIKTAIAFSLVSVMTISLCACGKDTRPVVNLSLWGSSDENPLLCDLAEEFTELHSNEAVINIKVCKEGEDTCKETILANPNAAGDVFSYPDDQLEELYEAGALLPATYEEDEVIAENGGKTSQAIKAASYKDGTLCGYPSVYGNGYILYYNSKYFSDEDVKSLDKILEIADENDKKFSMDFTSGWYTYSFFEGAGLEVNSTGDGHNTCNWNSTDTKYKGVDVGNAMYEIAKHKSFTTMQNSDFVEAMKNEELIACVSGLWHSKQMAEALGDNLGAAKLPKYTVAGDSVQMASFCGYKIEGVSANSKNPEWAMKLARFLSDEKNQIKRFEYKGECPSNVKAATSLEVQSSPAVAALNAQSEYSHLQEVSDTFWDPTYIFGTQILSGNLDGLDMQTMLDDMVKGITS